MVDPRCDKDEEGNRRCVFVVDALYTVVHQIAPSITEPFPVVPFPPLVRSTPADIGVRGAELANSDAIYLQGIYHNADIDPVIAVAADNGPVAAVGGVRAINRTGAPTNGVTAYAQRVVCPGFIAEQEVRV